MAKIKWIETAHCPWPDEYKLPGAHCKACQNGGFEGKNTAERYDIPEKCPFGISFEDMPDSKPLENTPDTRHNEARSDGRKDYTGCQSCKEKMLKRMKGD